MKIRISAAIAIAAVLALGAAAFFIPPMDTPAPVAGRQGVIAPIETVKLKPGVFAYHLPGEFLKSGRADTAPVVKKRLRHGVEIMKYQVSAAEYAACVAEQACAAADMRNAADEPVTGVNWRDAVAYARWLSEKTGETWRLPSDEEWAFAAAERFGTDASGAEADDSANPAARWLAAYRYRTTPRERDMQPKKRGYFGVNSNGVADISGNVWEWTDACFERIRLDASGQHMGTTVNCGVRVIGGQHRGYMSNFLRDGKSGGCAAGMAPPDNLGFRLVRAPKPAIGVVLLQRLTKAIVSS